MTITLTLGDIASRFGCELHGDPDIRVRHIATLKSADGESLAFLANPAYRSQLETTRAAAVIVSADDAAACPTAALVAVDPYAAYARVATELHPSRPLQPGIHPTATVTDGAKVPASCEVGPGSIIEAGVTLGERVFVGPGAVIGCDSQIGDDTRLWSNVTVYHGVRIGARCIFHSGVVIGADGFGFAQEAAGWAKVPQIGGVEIGDDVEIGANSTVDRGAIDDTVISDGVKLDNQIQVAHNVMIGPHTVMAAQSGISGSSTIGSRCIIGGASSIAGHISICDNVILAGGSGVASSIDTPGAYGGFPAMADKIGRWRKNAVRYGQLDEMYRRLRKLERQAKDTTGDK